MIELSKEVEKEKLNSSLESEEVDAEDNSNLFTTKIYN